MKRTKIIATIGPVSSDPKILKSMMEAGMNAARLNFSHGTFASHTHSIEVIRKTSKELGIYIPIFQDLSGPKLRLGEFKEKNVREGELLVFGHNGIPVQREIWKWIKPGQEVLIDDGLVELIVTKVKAVGFEASVVVPGVIKSNKGLSLPGVKVDLPSLSEKDLTDLEFGVKSGVDYVALSFVKKASDVQALRRAIKKLTDRKVRVIAKIETIDAIKNLSSIIKASDMIMIARGDLALNIPQQLVPVYQKKITRDCQRSGVPVICATQMLDSMINNPRPTRAEMSDVANAVLDQVDCVMLSGETAFGKYPVKVIETMTSIISEVEKTPLIERRGHSERRTGDMLDKNTIMAHSLVHIAQSVKAQAITVANFEMAVAISHFRPLCPIVLLTKDDAELRPANLVWGVLPHYKSVNPESLMRNIGLVKKGERYIDASEVQLSASIHTLE
ncbi:MAG: pyruvate kinase [Candidatus Doudnabacteria bacterium]|nr:pyruvate kinase [Candidatus Doudnabacteria bacterium]